MIYLDSAAVVKLAHAEPESAALHHWLDERAETGWISSILTEIEAFRALAWYARDAVSRLPVVLDQMDLIDLNPRTRILARAVEPATVRSLDAVHLGTALHSARADLVRDLRQAPPGRGSEGRPPRRLARLTASGGAACPRSPA